MIVQTPASLSRLLLCVSLLSWQKQRAGLVHVSGKLELLFHEIHTTRFTTNHHYSELLMPVLGSVWGPPDLRITGDLPSSFPLLSSFHLSSESPIPAPATAAQSFQDMHLFFIIHSRLLTRRGRTNNFCIKRQLAAGSHALQGNFSSVKVTRNSSETA